MSDFIEDQFWQEEVDRARNQTAEEKLRLGGELFDYACEVALAGIRAQYPGVSEDRAMDILRSRLELSRRVEGML